MAHFKNKLDIEYLYILAFISVIGLFLSLYLFYQYTLPTPVVCFGDVNTCETVRQSSYAIFLGIMLPFWGSLYFLFLSVFFLLPIFVDLSRYQKQYYYISALVILFGFLFESRLTYIQFFILDAVCIWCTLIEVTMVLLTLLYLYTFVNFSSTNKPNELLEN